MTSSQICHREGGKIGTHGAGFIWQEMLRLLVSYRLGFLVHVHWLIVAGGCGSSEQRLCTLLHVLF